MIMTMLKYCRERRLDVPYYLASVPATVGGAIAMNAGRGKEWNKSIFDFLHEVTWVEDGAIRTAKADATCHTHRQTPFVGLHRKLIINGIFSISCERDQRRPDPPADRLHEGMSRPLGSKLRQRVQDLPSRCHAAIAWSARG
jgi:UDP-N-acetylmuramate dehydrogenase